MYSASAVDVETQFCFRLGQNIVHPHRLPTAPAILFRSIVVKPGNSKWATVVEVINAFERVIPSFIILAGKVHQSNQYRELPADWAIAVSDIGWTTD